VVIFGYGNPLRGDDAVGWLAARKLQQHRTGDDVQVVACHQLNPEHAELAAQAERVIFIDASAEMAPGVITRTELHAAADPGKPFTHHLDPQRILAWARELYGACPQSILFTVGGEEFDGGEISPAVRAALPGLVEAVRVECRASPSPLRCEACFPGTSTR